jgi:hypothetical protein
MKKIALLLALTIFTTVVTAQDTIAVFVYSATKLNEPINALRSNIEGALINSAERKYVVLDRTEEFNDFLKKEYGYQEQGYVSNAQLIKAGNELGANKVCGVVISDYGEEGYFVECKILDIQKNQIDGTARYPNRSGDRILNLGIASSEKAAISIAEQLNLLSIEQKDQEEKRIKEVEEQKKREAAKRERRAEEQRIRDEKKREKEWRKMKLLNTPYFEEGKNRYIAWSVVGGSYPWGLTTGIESRFGGLMGFGLYADFGFCFTDITVEDGYNNFDNVIKTMVKYVGGITVYPYKGLFFDCGFGTISKPEEYVYEYYFSIHDDDDVEKVKRKVNISHGILIHIGYDYVGNLSDGKNLFIGISGGASYDLTNKELAPSINLKIGYAWGTK